MPAHPTVVDRGHSHDRTTFRKAAWVLTMAGTYIVPGFWRTYYSMIKFFILDVPSGEG
jgi:hypothetical protein